MLHPPNPPIRPNRPRSNSHPVRPLWDRGPSDANENAPVRPPRNPARPVALAEAQLAPPPIAFKDTTASGRDGREREIGDRSSPPINVSPPKSLVNKKRPAQTTPLPQINTLDRKILQELKQSMLARSAQFTLKNNVKHHPFPPGEVPYPRSYDHKCIDTDVWETIFCEQFCGNVTFHPFDVPPTKVLDLGCGSGSWIMACARQWKNCHFVGLDIVPLHPDLGQSELSQRVSWVQANFLQPLPFPNEEFDFVHVKRIARGVPEDKWGALFEEIIRVMKPGAALEMLEEDLYIPGQLMEATDTDSPLSILSSSGSSEELSPTWTSSIPGHPPSLLDISTELSHSSSQLSQIPISGRPQRRQSTSPTTSTTSRSLSTRSKSRSTPPSPQNVRPFPMVKPRKPKVRSKTSHFNLQNLLPKRPGRDDRAGTDGGPSRGNKKQPPAPVPLSAGLNPLLTPGTPTTPNQDHSAEDSHRPTSSAGGFPSPESHSSTGGATSHLTLGSSAKTNATPAPARTPHSFGEGDPPLTLTPPESTDDKLEVGFPRCEQNDSPKRARTRSLSCPTPEEDEQRRSIASRGFRPSFVNAAGTHDHLHRARSSNSRYPSISILTDMESIESNRHYGKHTMIPSPLPPTDIPGKQKPRLIPSISPSAVSDSGAGLSRSVPDRFTDRNGDQLLSPAPGSARPIKSLSTSSLAISTSRSAGEAPPPRRNDLSSDASGADNSISSPTAEIPPNPRQHKILEVIYTEMHAVRFVNLAPLRLLENYIRTYFKNVRTHAPLNFSFPPPPGCEHRPEFDLSELLAFPPPPGCENRPEFNLSKLQRGKLSRVLTAEDYDDQDRYPRPDIPPSPKLPTFFPGTPQSGGPKFIPSHPTRERSQSVTSNEPGPSRARSWSTRSSLPSTADLETTDRRQMRSRGPKSAWKGRVFTARSDISTGTSDYVTTDRSTMGRSSPASATASANQGTSSASDERERPRQRSDSLFTRSNNAEGEIRKRLLLTVHTLTRPSTASSIPPPSVFEYKTPNATSTTSLSPSMTSSSSSTIIQHESGKGKRGLTAAERAQLNALPNKRAEIDDRNLNLHLRARVVEILGCSEAMWGWVKEFQGREMEKERKRKEEELALAAKTVQGVGGGRVSYYHRDRARQNAARERQISAAGDLHRKRSAKSFTASGSRKRHDDGNGLNGDDQGKISGYVAESPSSYFSTLFGSTKGGDPSDRMEKSVKQELLHMSRERFEEILSWFQFDMDDSIRLTRSMAVRTPSSSFTADPTEQRNSFDVACQKFEGHLRQHPQHHNSLTKSNDSSNESGSSNRSSQYSQPCEDELCCLPPLLNLVHPSKRLCRTIRVWVAWKP